MFPQIRKVVFFLFLSFFGISSVAWAASPSINLQVDRDTIAMGENLQVTITIKGGSALTTPEIPALGNFDVVGKSSGNTIEIINGKMSLTNTFTYILEPRQAGEFPIGPVNAHIDGKTYSAGPLRVKVLAAQSNQNYVPSPPGQALPGYPQNPPNTAPGESLGPTPPPINKGESGYPDTFITAQTDKKDAYVGEQILFTFRLYTAVSIENAQLSLPEFKDFITEELIKERKFETTLEGRRYAVNEWRLALFPTKAGTLETGKSTVHGMVSSARSLPFEDPFFDRFVTRAQMVQHTFSAPSIALHVKELPPPPGGYTGLVGQFSISSHLGQDVLHMGDTSNLQVEISGTGNIGEANLPALPETPFFKIYPDKPTLKLDKTLQGVQGKKTFSYALVAERPGQTEIPGFKLYYFDPASSSYQELNTPARKILIQGATQKEKLVTAGIESPEGFMPSESGALDLRELKPAATLLDSQTLPRWEKTLWLMLLFGIPGCYFLYLLIERARARALAQAEDRKRSKAFKRAKVALGDWNPGKDGEGFSRISSILKEYLSDRFLIKGAAMTPGEVEIFLKEKKVPAESLRRMIYLLEQLDSWKYGGGVEHLPEKKELKQEITNLLREIEKAA